LLSLSTFIFSEVDLLRLRKVISILLIVILSACAFTPGGAEFTAYREAFETSRSSSEALFDLLALAERKQEKLAAGSAQYSFDPNAAYLYTDTADPPLTNEYRLSFNTISEYNQLMMGLLSGDSARTLSGDAQQLASEVSGTAAALAGKAAFLQVDTLISIAGTLSEAGLIYNNRNLFTQKLAGHSEAVVKLMKAMRDNSGQIYKNLSTTGANLEKHQKVVADWVILIDRNIGALEAALDSAQNPRIQAADLVTLQNRMTEIRDAAKSVREGLAELAAN